MPSLLFSQRYKGIHSDTMYFYANHNHQLNWWYALALKGHRTCKRLKTRRRDCQPHLYSQAAPKGAFLLPMYSCYPWTGLCTLSAISDHWQCLPATGSVCILLSLFCFVPQCQHSSLCTRNACCHIYISYSHVDRKSWVSFCPWYIPWFAQRYTLAVCWSACGYDQDIIQPQLFLCPFGRTVVLWFFLCPPWSFHRSPVVCISVRILCDNGIAILNVINCLYHHFYSSFITSFAQRCGW